MVVVVVVAVVASKEVGSFVALRKALGYCEIRDFVKGAVVGAAIDYEQLEREELVILEKKLRFRKD